MPSSTSTPSAVWSRPRSATPTRAGSPRGLAELGRGDVEAVVAAARGLALDGATAADVATALGHFETNRERMRYGRYRGLGLFVGSGAVEAGCRAVVAQRLKLSGMRWTVRGAAAIMSLRCEEASGRWDDIWTRLHVHTRVACAGTYVICLTPSAERGILSEYLGLPLAVRVDPAKPYDVKVGRELLAEHLHEPPLVREVIATGATGASRRSPRAGSTAFTSRLVGG